MRASVPRSGASTGSHPAAQTVFRAKAEPLHAGFPLHNAPAFREYSHSPDTGTYCIDYVTSQLTVKHNVRAYPRVISRAVARFAEGGRVAERVGSSRGVDVGEEGARRLRTHRADGYISRLAGARTRAAPPGLVARLAAGRAPPRATDHAGPPPPSTQTRLNSLHVRLTL